ncbi:glycosyltransferase 87 family protein [Microlunatus ginsengisoli]|uniref:DUF2029 domain-containing protein n=1 Tax=Microlunatus ginsengisoli TaxID=363863 RepID=A0ABP7AYK6_9ACTN
MSVDERWRRLDHRGHVALTAIGLATLAIAARLLPLLRGGGLTGLGNYDDGVYYSAGTALLHGLLPYRDYVFLHPPGIILLLAPFGLAGVAGHDPTGLAVARLGCVLLGAINTLLVAVILRPAGRVHALVGAAFYATAFPAIYIEWTPLLEGPAQTCLLASVALLARCEADSDARWLPVFCAGGLLGISATFKIWGVVAVVTVLAWYGLRRRWRAGGWIALGAAAGTTIVCLPFFAAAPVAMWRMVVTDQLGRNRSAMSVPRRLAAILDLGLHARLISHPALLAGAFVVAVAVLVAATRVAPARLCVVLTLSLSTLLAISPSWFLHYPGLATGPLAVSVGAGTGFLIRAAAARRRWAGASAAVLVGLLLAFGAAPLPALRLGTAFPAQRLAVAMRALPPTDCVTADDPATLVALNVLTRDLDHGCPFVADLGGFSYELATERGGWVRREDDPRWQRLYLGYLASGDVTLSCRFGGLGALAPTTTATVSRWPVIIRAGRYAVRMPN